jgi:hypothetical protein
VSQLGQQYAEGVARVWRGVLAPAGHQQFVAGQRPATVEDQIGEHDPSSAAREPVLDAGAVDVDGEATAQLDPGLGPLAHQATSDRRSLSFS